MQVGDIIELECCFCPYHWSYWFANASSATEFSFVLFKIGSCCIVHDDPKETILLPRVLIAEIVSLCYLTRLPYFLVFFLFLINRVPCNPGWLHTHLVVLAGCFHSPLASALQVLNELKACATTLGSAIEFPHGFLFL